MAIKIPSAAELGLGTRTPGAIPEGTPVPRRKIDTGVGLDIARGIVQIAGAVVSEEKAQIEKDRLKLERADILKRKTDSNISMANLLGNVSAVTDTLANSDMSPEELRTTFNNEMRVAEKAFTETIDPGLQEQYKPQLINAFNRAQSKFATKIDRNAKDFAIAKGIEALDSISKTAASTGELGAAKKQVSQIVDALPMDANKKSVIKAREKAKIDNVAVKQLLTERDGGIYRTELDTLIKDLKAKDADGQFTNYKDLPPEARTTYIDQAERAKIQDETSQTRVVREQTKSALSKFKDLTLGGFPIPPEEVAKLEKIVKGTEFEQTFKDIKEQGASLEHIAKKYTQAPLDFGAAQLGYRIPPLDVTDPEEMTRQLVERIPIGKAIQATIGGSFAPILKNEEVKQLAALMESDISVGVRVMDTITATVGRDIATGIAMQMGNTDPEKASILRAVADGDLSMARDLATGQELISTKALLMPKPQESLEWFWDESGRALLGYPNNGKEAVDAFHAIYAATAQANGVQDGEFDEDIAEIAYQRAIGEVEDINNFQTIIQPGIDEADLRNGIRRIRGDFIAAQGGIVDMEDVAAARAIREDGQFYSAGPNIYRVMLNNQLVMTKQVSPETGQNFPLQFDVSGLKDRPEAFIPPAVEEALEETLLGGLL